MAITTRHSLKMTVAILEQEIDYWQLNNFNATDKKAQLQYYKGQLYQLNQIDPVLSREGVLRELAQIGTRLKGRVDCPVGEDSLETVATVLTDFRRAYLAIANGAEPGDVLRRLRFGASSVGERPSLELIITAAVYGFGVGNINDWAVVNDSIVHRSTIKALREDGECLASD